MTAYRRQYFRSARPASAIADDNTAAGTRGLLPDAATRSLSGSISPSVRRIDDKCRIHHPPLLALSGWEVGVECTVSVDDDFLHVRPATGAGAELGRFDGTRLRLPPARLQAIGVAPGEDVALLVDPDTGTVTIAAGAHLTDAFWAIGERERLRNQLSAMTAERDRARADADAAQRRAEVLTEVLAAFTSTDAPAPVALVAR